MVQYKTYIWQVCSGLKVRSGSRRGPGWGSIFIANRLRPLAVEYEIAFSFLQLQDILCISSLEIKQQTLLFLVASVVLLKGHFEFFLP